MVRIENVERTLVEQPFFKDVSERARTLIAGCTAHAVFHDGEKIFCAGDPADNFFVIRHGAVALEVSVPGREPLVIETLGKGEVLGWSWLIPPYRTQFDARAIGLVRVLRIEGKCLRAKCEDDHTLGYEFYKSFLAVVADRLAAARLQMIDIYGHPNSYADSDIEFSEQPMPPAKPSPGE